jgi:DNA-binding PadR family transcriptional regulator
MKRKQPIANRLQFDRQADDFKLGPAYLEYCVRKGWLKKTGEPPLEQYEMTEAGKKKLGHVRLNFDLSAINSKGGGLKKKRRRLKK